MRGLAGREGTHHRSWAPATRCARLSGHRLRRSWPRRCKGSLCRRSRSRRRSGSSARRAEGPRRGGRPRTWRTSAGRMPRLQTWLWRKKAARGVGGGAAPTLGAPPLPKVPRPYLRCPAPRGPGTTPPHPPPPRRSEIPPTGSSLGRIPCKTTSLASGNHCDFSSAANKLS